MADVLVGFLLDNLTRLLSHEANLLLGVEDEVRTLKDELKLTHSYLKSFEGKYNHHHQALTEEYISQIWDLVHEAEDVIDEYVAFDFRKQGYSFWESVKSKYYQLTVRRRVAEKITNINTRFNTLYGNRDKFRIQEPNPSEVSACAEASDSRKRLPIEETDVVGFDLEAKMIIEQLTKGKAERDVIPIVGMGGIGKTTLAAKVYNDPIVLSWFDHKAWVVVSKDYSVRELLEAVIKSTMLLTDEMKKMTDKELGLELRGYLRGARRYLIVLDDVWETELWEKIQHCFPNNLRGSRIILTTRKKEVALSANPSNDPHYLKFLTDEDSWKLLCLKVFGKQECPDLKLEDPGKQIAKECGGLPLAIVVIAGVLLKKEKTTRWWFRVSSRVSKFINEHTERCSEIFSWSYKDLPHHLRPCFLYLGLFPEDHEISTKQLTLLWLAEGFIPEKEQMSPEDVAYDCLEELADRNLVQVATQKFDGSIKSCRIHDLLREFCISEALKRKFLAVYRHDHSLLPGNSRRLGIHSNPLQCIGTNCASSNLRSLICFEHNDDKRLSSKHWKLLCKGHMLLRVLDLWDVYVDDIPNEIYKFICLRYLRLKSDSAVTLPLSVCNLWNLETLDVTAPLIERPTINIWKMRQLRHFYFNGEAVLAEPPKKMIKEQDYLNNLQTLSSISPDSCTWNALSLVPNLVKLGIYGDIEKSKSLAFNNLSKLQHLQKLKLMRDRRYQPAIDIPSSIDFPSSLIRLTLSQTQLIVDPMELLGKRLPKLQVLKLKDGAYSGDMLNCTQGGFPRLEVLKLVNLGVTNWKISPGSMPSLIRVVINRCSGLKGLPSSMQQMPTLQELQLWYPNVLVAECARKIETCKGKDQFKLLINHAENGDDMH
ncbi:hypothetical protein JCGZ_16249 [Jatropha curcas]|uniref:NB-ARC domain-containing protein n=1 Tax=Jatropha curcas TaxID=180498 RepID=A0A067K300_JATCU|nr:putative disease resistance RPP13-like protein 3 [Jatropha curcas]KDP30596.1 hypothetical protein JCGZ_16249 [Jatropha curcas]